MTFRIYGALISLSAAGLLLAANETFARSGAAQPGGSASAHSMRHPSAAPSFRHHRKGNEGFFWPPAAGFFYEPPNGEPTLGIPPAAPADYSYGYDVPWDWAHRYPPIVIPSERPYVTSCPEETVTVPGRDDKEHTISIMRCY
jgi:hypothetical protein